MANQQHFLSGKTIAIAGAGVAGLAFAIAIRKFWDESTLGPPPNIRIFERDTRENAIGREGYSLSLRSDNGAEGIQALQKLGILDSMIEASITGHDHRGSFGLWDKDWKTIMKVGPRSPPGLPVGALRIARNEMRKVLIKAFVEQSHGSETIEWGKACKSVEQAETGGLVVHINGAETVECDFLVVADGASSKLRTSMRPDDKLQFAGVSALAATAVWADKPPKPLDQDWGMVLSGTGTALFVSPIDDKRAVWSLSWTEPRPREVIKFPEEQTRINALLQEAEARGAWLPPLWQEIMEHTDTSTLWLMNAMDKPAFGHTSLPYKSQVMFIGDANHAVSPFAGAGANMALMDGLDLANSLLDTPSLIEASQQFDSKAVPRAKRILAMSHFTIRVAHSGGWRYWLYLWFLKAMYWVFLRKYVEMKT